MDKQAEAGCRNFARLWEPFLEIPIQVEFAEKLKGISLGDSLMVVVATHTPATERLSAVFSHSHKNLVWIGPKNEVIARTENQGIFCMHFI